MTNTPRAVDVRIYGRRRERAMTWNKVIWRLLPDFDKFTPTQRRLFQRARRQQNKAERAASRLHNNR